MLRRALLATALLAALSVLAACGEDEAATRTAPSAPPADTSDPRGVAIRSCDASAVTVDFVQRESITVTGDDGAELAKADYKTRTVSSSCEAVRVPRAAAKVLGSGLFRDVRVTCEAGGEIVITVLPIMKGERAVGSTLALHAVEGTTGDLLLSAVLQNRQRYRTTSRVQFDRNACRPAR